MTERMITREIWWFEEKKDRTKRSEKIRVTRSGVWRSHNSSAGAKMLV